jgi:hypothetical protein
MANSAAQATTCAIIGSPWPSKSSTAASDPGEGEFMMHPFRDSAQLSSGFYFSTSMGWLAIPRRDPISKSRVAGRA